MARWQRQATRRDPDSLPTAEDWQRKADEQEAQAERIRAGNPASPAIENWLRAAENSRKKAANA